jgi:hypothetical protein
MSYGIIRAKFVKQYESTRYDFRFCKSVKFLYSGVKKSYSERCLEENFLGLFIQKSRKCVILPH